MDTVLVRTRLVLRVLPLHFKNLGLIQELTVKAEGFLILLVHWLAFTGRRSHVCEMECVNEKGEIWWPGYHFATQGGLIQDWMKGDPFRGKAPFLNANARKEELRGKDKMKKGNVEIGSGELSKE